MEITGNDAAAAGLADSSARSPAKRLLDQARALARRGNPERKPRRVLIVDDDPAIRTLCAFNLQQEGLVVVEAADGRLALEEARSERPDLVVTDVMMPGLDGFELAEALQRDERTRDSADLPQRRSRAGERRTRPRTRRARLPDQALRPTGSRLARSRRTRLRWRARASTSDPPRPGGPWPPSCLSSPRHPAATLELSGTEVSRRAARASPCYPAKGRRCEER